jgi:fatty acid desaturase
VTRAPLDMRLNKRSDLVSGAVITLHLAFIFAPVYLSSWLGFGPLWLLFWFWFGVSNNALLNLMHETAHLHVFHSRAAASWLGHWLLGPLMFVDFDRYRELHWAHHRNLGRDGDPKYSYTIDIRGRRSLAFLLRSLTLGEALRKVRYVHLGSEGSQAKAPVRASRAWLARTALVQAVFGGSLVLVSREPLLFALLDAALAYGFIYIYGTLSLTIMMANLRAIAEHQIGDEQAEISGRAALRNLRSNALTRLIFGAYGFAEHASHHHNPAIPYYLLPSEIERAASAAPGLRPGQGYFSALRHAVATPSPGAQPLEDAGAE